MGGLPQGSGTIMVADDDAEVRDLTGRILKMAGYTVVEAFDAPSTVEAIAQNAAVRLLLLDLNMPGSPSCGRTVRRLREIRPQLPILVITGFPESETHAQLGDQEVAGLLEKPFAPPVLIARIREILGED